ncbi:MAG: type III-B CRISPR-associated protein Cas10/Cmr2 [Planctomycetota bacterium]|nr:MAG: type III-B CRISPR-associated protein Cas10/Cmr2 [Planctomycetota bacterium]
MRAAFTAVWSLFSLPAMEPKQKATEEVHKTARCLGRRMQCWERMLKVVNEIKRNGKDQIAGPLFGTMRQLGRHYGLMVDALNALFDSAKVSDMREPLSEQVGAKCRICGIRSAVIAGPDLLGKENSLETLTLKKVLCDETEALKRIRAAFEAYGKQSPDCCQDAEITQKLTPRYIHPKEALCAVCFLKRALDVWVCKEVLGNSKQDQQIGFPSTAEVATSNVKEVVCNTNLLQRLRDALKRILSSAEKNLLHGSQPLPRIQRKCGITYDANIDGEWLFESEWRKEKLEQEYGIMRVRKDAFVDVLGNVEEKDEERRRGLLRLIREQAEKAGEKLTAYYAVVMADGDEMGKWISGAKGPDWKEVFHPQVWKEIEGGGLDKKLRELFPHRPLTPAIHAAISTGLRNFALELVPRILEQQYLGKVVYAGGDDLLAFLNLRDLLPAIHLLRLAYSGMIKCERQQIHPDPSNRSGFVEIDGRYLPTMGPNATLSVGVCIAHYKAPLRLALAAARRSLDILAKQNAGRDAVGFCVLKHSGETVEVGAKWWVSCDFCGSRFELLPSLGQLCNSMRQEQPMYVSDTFITGLQEEFGAFKAQGLPVEAVQREIRRLVQRAVNATPQTERQKKQEFAERVASLVTGFYCCASRKDWDSFISLLRLAQFLVREGAKWTLNSGS